jgi:hypothetical protein
MSVAMKRDGSNRRASASRLFFRMVNDISSTGRGGKAPGRATAARAFASRPRRFAQKFDDCASLEPADPHEFNR